MNLFSRPFVSTFMAIALIALTFSPRSHARAAELAELSKSNWDQRAPKGKEVDAIYGDYVLRNEYITAVIAKPAAGRNANLTTKEVAGCLLDLTINRQPNDQLTAFYPAMRRVKYRSRLATPLDSVGPARLDGKQPTQAVAVQGVTSSGVKITTTYVLSDGWRHLNVITRFTNADSDKPLTADLGDALRADRTFEHGVDEALNMYWVYDRWFGQAYAFVGGHGGAELDRLASLKPSAASRGRVPGTMYFQVNGQRQVALKKGESISIERSIIPGRDVLEVKAIAQHLKSTLLNLATINVEDASGPVANADVVLNQRVKDKVVMYGRARTDTQGQLITALPSGEYEAVVTAIGRTRQVVKVVSKANKDIALTVTLDQPGYVVGHITNEQGGRTPCKVQFLGIEGTANPYFFVDSGSGSVVNLHYSHTGQFTQEIGPGKYNVVISYGPEYDAVFKQIQVKRGQVTKITGQMVRVVDTTGWVSAEYHSHSSPSGDNTSSQQGRVLNLLAEHLEFAPCTEHQRIDSYMPILKHLGVTDLMATCSGIEMTGSPLDSNHHNVFPLVHKPYTQNGGGGGPTIDADPRKQIQRLVYWDDKAEKIVQQNHPNLVKVVLDKNLDGKYDGGFGTVEFMDIVEIHPPQNIFKTPRKNDKNRMVNWMQLLNLGYRVPGVVNTDAHYNNHGSGWLRNYIKSSTDDPAKIDTIEMVRNSEKGNIVMTTGPFMTVQMMSNTEGGNTKSAHPGEDLAAKGGKVAIHVTVQCANWLDINRVQLFVNGVPDKRLNYTRETHPKFFGDGVVKFHRAIDVSLDNDAHIIVAAIGEGMTLEKVMGSYYGKRFPPVAVSNPVFVDVDGKGFQPNGDTLGVDLPLKNKAAGE